MKTTLEEQIRACQLCPLYLHMPFSPIPGWGNKKAKIMLVGEAPGKDEAIIEEPFVGRCGKFLDKNLLEPAGLNRSDLYITNTVKCCCRTGNKNRKPLKSEIWACNDWLDKEIRTIPFSVIITLGEIATKSFIKYDGKFGDVVGKEFPIENITSSARYYTIIPCFHPSYLMTYSRDKTELALKVFKKAKEMCYT